MSTGEIWKNQRRMIAPAFSLPILHGYLGVFNTKARELVEIVSTQTEPTFNILPYIKDVIFKILSKTVFGVDELDDKNFIKQYMNATDTILKNFVDRFNNPLLYSDFMYQLLGYKKIEDEIIRISSNMSDTIINAKRAALKASKSTIYSMNSKGAKYKSLLELLLELSEKNMLTNKEIKDEVNTFVVAGYDTCSIVLTYTLMCLGTYPEVQERVHEEIQTIFGDTDRDVEKEDLSHLLYTEAVIKETLRLYPPGPFLLRYCDKVVQLKNYKMPADTQLILNMYGMNRDPVWGPDAEHFRPDRWLDLKLEQSNAFGSFSIGKRICPGE
ncbi:cytochrome P450 4c21-like [Manduca sexta]|uniref:cytochrome P450 4c21-like n=1 Tax=Manduca sexta TaxID=7130 RepID=UPI00188F4C61|nr:cytochrome P450 4c21-like [Manduca sexta]